MSFVVFMIHQPIGLQREGAKSILRGKGGGAGVNKLPLPAAPPQGTNNDFYQEQGSLMNRKLNSDHFTFLKHLNRTYGSKVMKILSFFTKYLGINC